MSSEQAGVETNLHRLPTTDYLALVMEGHFGMVSRSGCGDTVEGSNPRDEGMVADEVGHGVGGDPGALDV